MLKIGWFATLVDHNPRFGPMAAGVPVVASAVGAASGYIDNGRSGYPVEAGDVDGFVSACAALIESSAADRREMIDAGMNAVTMLTWPATARATRTGMQRRSRGWRSKR